jgi:hypothetical protein
VSPGRDRSVPLAGQECVRNGNTHHTDHTDLTDHKKRGAQARRAAEEADLFGERPEKPVRRARRTRLPEDIILTDELMGLAVSNGLGDVPAAAAWKKFVAHARDTGRVSADWRQAWLKWVLREKELISDSLNRRTNAAPESYTSIGERIIHEMLS